MKFLSVSVVICTLFLASCGPTTSAPEEGAAVDLNKIYRWRMVTTWPKNFPGMGMAPEKIAERVRVMSRGRLDITVYGAGEVVPALETFEAVSQGTVQMGHGAVLLLAGQCPGGTIFYGSSLWTVQPKR